METIINQHNPNIAAKAVEYLTAMTKTIADGLSVAYIYRDNHNNIVKVHEVSDEIKQNLITYMCRQHGHMQAFTMIASVCDTMQTLVVIHNDIGTEIVPIEYAFISKPLDTIAIAQQDKEEEELDAQAQAQQAHNDYANTPPTARQIAVQLQENATERGKKQAAETATMSAMMVAIRNKVIDMFIAIMRRYNVPRHMVADLKFIAQGKDTADILIIRLKGWVAHYCHLYSNKEKDVILRDIDKTIADNGFEI